LRSKRAGLFSLVVNQKILLIFPSPGSTRKSLAGGQLGGNGAQRSCTGLLNGLDDRQHPGGV
jgi:hypothetical protein